MSAACAWKVNRSGPDVAPRARMASEVIVAESSSKAAWPVASVRPSTGADERDTTSEPPAASTAARNVGEPRKGSSQERVIPTSGTSVAPPTGRSKARETR